MCVYICVYILLVVCDIIIQGTHLFCAHMSGATDDRSLRAVPARTTPCAVAHRKRRVVLKQHQTNEGPCTFNYQKLDLERWA